MSVSFFTSSKLAQSFICSSNVWFVQTRRQFEWQVTRQNRVLVQKCFFGLGEAPGLKVEGEGRNIPHIITTPEPETVGLTAFDLPLSKFR